MTGLKRNTDNIKRRKIILAVISLGYFIIGCSGNELQSKANKTQDGSTNDAINVYDTVNDRQTNNVATTDIKNFLGVFKTSCRDDSKTYLTFTLLKKAQQYFVRLKKHPANKVIVEGELKRDTVNFFKEVNVWSIEDDNGLTYPFVFNERELEPCEHKNCPGYVTLINADYKRTLGNDCFRKSGYLFFVGINAKRNQPVRKGSYKKEWAALQTYIGSYSLDSLETSWTQCKMHLTLTQKDSAYRIQLRFPKQNFVLAGAVHRDTINFDPDSNIWSLKDKQNNVYGFLFDPDRPNEICLVNEDAKEIFEKNCVVGKTILFTKTSTQ